MHHNLQPYDHPSLAVLLWDSTGPLALKSMETVPMEERRSLYLVIRTFVRLRFWNATHRDLSQLRLCRLCRPLKSAMSYDRWLGQHVQYKDISLKTEVAVSSHWCQGTAPPAVPSVERHRMIGTQDVLTRCHRYHLLLELAGADIVICRPHTEVFIVVKMQFNCTNVFPSNVPWQQPVIMFSNKSLEKVGYLCTHVHPK